MKINDLRISNLVKLENVLLGQCFLLEGVLYMVVYDKEYEEIAYVCLEGNQPTIMNIKSGTLVTPVNVEINIID